MGAAPATIQATEGWARLGHHVPDECRRHSAHGHGRSQHSHGMTAGHCHQRSGDPLGYGGTQVGPLGFEPSLPPGQRGNEGLGTTLAIASADEVPPRRPSWRHIVIDSCSGHIDETSVRLPVGHADAELGLLAPCGIGTHPTECLGETTKIEEYLSAEGHIGTDEVSYRSSETRHARMAATDDPVEFGWKPSRATVGKPRLDMAPDPDDIVKLIGPREVIKPVRSRSGIVVDEGDDVSRGNPQTFVPGTGKPL